MTGDGTMGQQVETRSVPTLADVPAEAWDALVLADGLYMSHAWLKALESDPAATPTYLLAYRDGRLDGALPLYEVHEVHNSFYGPERYLAQLRTEGRWLLVGTHSAYRSGVPLRGDLTPEERVATTGALVTAAVTIARERGARGVVSLFTPTAAAELLVRCGGVAALDTAEGLLETGGRTLDEVLAGLPRHRRNRLRHEVDVFDAAGYEVATESLDGCVDELAPLLRNVQVRYGHEASVEGMRDYLGGLLAAGDAWVVFSLREEGRLVGAAVMHPCGSTLFARLVGFDYAALRDAYEYFGLAYYEPVRWMAEHGLTSLHLGIEAYDAKVLRGARLHPLWTVAVPVDPTDAPRPGAPDVAAWTERYGTAAPADAWRVPWLDDETPNPASDERSAP